MTPRRQSGGDVKRVMDLGGGWLKWRSLSRPTPDVIVLNGNSKRFCIQCGQDYGLAFFYSNGRGGKRPRCKGCMMTRRHNLKRARLGLPPYPEAAPYVPLRTKRREQGLCWAPPIRESRRPRCPSAGNERDKHLWGKND